MSSIIKIKNNIINQIVKRRKLCKNSGVATAETILIIAIMLVIVITVFYPQIKNILTNTFNTLETWYSTALSNLGMF